MNTALAEALIVAMVMVCLTGGFTLAIIAFIYRNRLRELAVKERIAMIERGLVPSPEADPARFDAMVGSRRPMNEKAARYRSAGIIITGLGAAMFVLLAFAAGIPDVAFGIGGALAVIGLATFFNGTMAANEPPA